MSNDDGENCAPVMDLLGDDLEELFHICGKKLSLKSVLMLADQMVRVATIARGLVYLSLQLLDHFSHKFDLPFRLIGLGLSTPNLVYTEISSLPIFLREGKLMRIRFL